jgi:phage terminase large subunit GpA-like protein
MIPEDRILKSFKSIFSKLDFSDKSMLPSEFAERYIILDSAISSLKQGKFDYNLTPYLREVVDCASPYHPAKIIAVMKGAQIGFALDVETPIITPKGWVKMGDLNAGDYVFGDNGMPTKIIYATGIMYNHECFKVTFSDNSSLIADKNHLWGVYDKKENYKVFDTERLFKDYKVRCSNGKTRNRYAIYNTKHLEFYKKDYIIDPYLLGLWLGNGCVSSNRIAINSKDSDEIRNNIINIGEECQIDKERYSSNCHELVLKREDCKFNSRCGYVRFGERMQKYGIYAKKTIPECYLYGSVGQRLSLIQGMMDTDGSITKNGTCEYYSINKDLIYGFCFILNSLGYKYTIREREQKNIKIVDGKSYECKNIFIVNFYAFKELPVFRLKRKYDRLNEKSNTRYKEICRRRITGIEKIDSVPVRCISIDNESKLFLAGKTMIPTHNSQGVIVPAILWKIANDPGNIVSLSANDALSKRFVEQRLDPIIQRCYVKDLIRPNAIKKRNSRTGDTSISKEFAGGSAMFGGLQSFDNLGKQMSFSLGFYDDWDAAKVSDKTQGNTFELLRQRFSSSANTMKQFFIGTPECEPSNIRILYDMGDKRKWIVPCPRCGKMIEIIWYQKNDSGDKIGIVFDKNDAGKLDEKSVGYVCQECGNFFKEKHKYEMNLSGCWTASCEPSMTGFYSYHIPAFCAAPGMFGWTDYAHQWLRIYADGYEDKGKLKVFMNVVAGMPWEEKKTVLNSHELLEHTRNYQIGIVPSLLSESDGNDKIILLTLACDLNGTENDARLDYEIVAHSISGSIYSIDHGSIGTYQPGARHQDLRTKGMRECWTYRFNEHNSVWKVLENNVLLKKYSCDDGRVMTISQSCIDTGHLSHFAYQFIEQYIDICAAIKGKDKDKFVKPTQDLKLFHKSREKSYLYLLEVDKIKDILSEMMSLKLKKDDSELQDAGSVNYPTPDYQLGKYTVEYFKQLSSEQKSLELDERTGEVKGWHWDKITSSSQNHFWDCAVYNIAAREIYVSNFIKEYNKKAQIKIEPTWFDFANLMKSLF